MPTHEAGADTYSGVQGTVDVHVNDWPTNAGSQGAVGRSKATRRPPLALVWRRRRRPTVPSARQGRPNGCARTLPESSSTLLASSSASLVVLVGGGGGGDREGEVVGVRACPRTTGVSWERAHG